MLKIIISTVELQDLSKFCKIGLKHQKYHLIVPENKVSIRPQGLRVSMQQVVLIGQQSIKQHKIKKIILMKLNQQWKKVKKNVKACMLKEANFYILQKFFSFRNFLMFLLIILLERPHLCPNIDYIFWDDKNDTFNTSIQPTKSSLKTKYKSFKAFLSVLFLLTFFSQYQVVRKLSNKHTRSLFICESTSQLIALSFSKVPQFFVQSNAVMKKSSQRKNIFVGDQVLNFYTYPIKQNLNWFSWGYCIILMMIQPQDEREIQLVLCQSTQPQSINLNELIRFHRMRPKFQIMDKFYNNSFILVENKLLQNQVYYQYDMLRFYLEDLGTIYFKEIQPVDHTRLQYVMRRLDFTLNGEEFNFKQFLAENRFQEDIRALFTDEYLEGLEQHSNDPKVVSLRNCMNLCLIIKWLYSLSFTSQEIADVLQKISKLYFDFMRKIKPKRPKNRQIDQYSQIKTKSAKYSEKPPQKIEYKSEKNYSTPEPLDKNRQSSQQDYPGICFPFEEMIYEEEISLRMIKLQVQNYHFQHQIADQNTSQEQVLKLQYLYQMNTEFLENLAELKQCNNRNRSIMNQIKKNIRRQAQSGSKCIINEKSDNVDDYYSKSIYSAQFDTRQTKMRIISDAECIEKVSLNIINKLKTRQIADAIEKVFEIQRNQHNHARNCGSLLFSVCFQKGLGITQAVLQQEQFIKLNQLRDQSLLTSYLTPMKSQNAHISQNIFTYMCLSNSEYHYNNDHNSNEQMMKKLRNKISRHRIFGTHQLKQQYCENFKMCHNCKKLCPKDFLKQCRNRVSGQRQRQIGQQSNDQSDDGSLYTQKMFKNRRNNKYLIECEKYFCIYCIKNQFNGKAFNDQECPFCLNSCQCNTCLREKMLKKLTDLYLQVGGDPTKLKTQKQMIQAVRVKTEQDQNVSVGESQSYMSFEENAYQSAIKKEIAKGYTAQQIQYQLMQQREMVIMLQQREKLKIQLIQNEAKLFRQKVSGFKMSFRHIDQEAEIEKREIEEQKRVKNEGEREDYNNTMKSRLRRSKRSKIRDKQRRKNRTSIKDQQVYDYYHVQNSDSEDQESAFRIYIKKSKEEKPNEEKYEPHQTF